MKRRPFGGYIYIEAKIAERETLRDDFIFQLERLSRMANDFSAGADERFAGQADKCKALHLRLWELEQERREG